MTSRAALISSFSTTSAPIPRASGDPATRTPFSRFSPPSAPSAVDGRMAPTTTTATGAFTARLRNQAVSSSEAVPCVTTIPARSGWAAAAPWIRRSNSSQSVGPMLPLPTLR